MLSSVLGSERAVMVNIEIMRAYVRMRQFMDSQRDLSKRLDQLELRYNAQFKVVFDSIRELMKSPTQREKTPIGFRPNEE